MSLILFTFGLLSVISTLVVFIRSLRTVPTILLAGDGYHFGVK